LLESRKSATGQLRFDDITQRLEPFAAQFESDRIAFRMDRQVQHLLLDEFQDTSLAQWNVIRPFAKAVTQSPDDARSFFCVGDLKQAIFGWRGGIAEIFDRVDEELPNLADPEKRADSWRSAPTVIELVNEVFLNLTRYKCNDPIGLAAVHQWGDWFEEHSTHKKELQGHVTLEMASGEVPPGAEELKATADAYSAYYEKVDTGSEAGYLMDHSAGVVLAMAQEFGFDVKDEHVEFYVSDTGIGIGKEELKNIFNRFYKMQNGKANFYPGNGLGLTITKNLVEALNGSITVVSVVGRGTTFRFTIPL